MLLLALACAFRQDEEVPTLAHTADRARIDVCSALFPPGPPASPPGIKAADQAIRILAFGDFGSGTSDQRRVAAAMRRYDEEHPIDFGITLGDNFYPAGLPNPTDARWIRRWENPYGPLGVRFYATLGNHDYRNPAGPAGEIQRSRHSRSWCLPRHFYTYTAGPAQLFAIDTVPIEQGDAASVRMQLDWLRKALRESRATWKIVYGHHPVYTNGEHGEDLGYLPGLKERLLPILVEQKVDVYLAGHEHDLEALKPEGGVSYFISGGGGKEKRPLQSSRCRAWAESAYGFTVLEARGAELAVRFFGAGGERLYEVSWKKGHPPPDCPRS